MKSSEFSRVLLICIFICVGLGISHGEESKKNKFREREASDDALGYPNMFAFNRIEWYLMVFQSIF